METMSLGNDDEDFKRDMEEVKSICRCCLSTGKFMHNACNFEELFKDLTGLSVLQSDGLPQWVCYECASLLRKAVRFKHKVLKAHSVLYEYLTRCAPFPIDAQDVELSKYSSPHLVATETLHLDISGKGRSGVYKVLQHVKKVQPSELDSVALPLLGEEQNNIKEEMGFSDYEDNITLEEFRLEANKITEDDLASILQETNQVEVKKEKEVKKKKKTKRKQEKKMESGDENEGKPRSSIRKTVELDPNKIRIVTLNPEEQIKQREEESKAGLRFPHQCHLCHKGFNFESKLQNHMAKHSPSRGPYECKLCFMYLPTNYSFSVHSFIHTRRYECVECKRRMIDRSSIIDHYKSQHEGLLTVYTCQICGKVSNNNKTHRGHMRNHHSGVRPKCEQCGKTFINNDSLKDHQQIHLGIKNYECDTCGKKFRTRTQIKHHQLKHSDVQEFYCVECDVRFKSSHSLRQHLTKSLKHRDKSTLMLRAS
ncbi:zinc finger and SCAN domain-containing protein 31-like [Trichoplusia ni]|uniref:Zinc finger and SCAN domain-containing protein 31-like n=1 Tax=Trichoplusia ni TaxID=7111 RepID=A0A7E5V8D9_TRINI|nr:zinc finger and SCAN domain-containing protein 31-like [Trichoplusia ni]